MYRREERRTNWDDMTVDVHTADLHIKACCQYDIFRREGELTPGYIRGRG